MSLRVIDRVLMLLHTLAESGEPLTLAEVTAAVRLPKSTVRRILMALESHRFCETTSDGRYRLGLTLLELGMRVLSRMDLRESARAELQALSRKTSLTAFLCIRDRDRAICIERVDGFYAHTLALQVGGSLPLHVGAAPLVLLAHCPQPEVDRYLTRKLEQFTDQTLTTAGQLLAAIRRIRDAGYRVASEDIMAGVASVGAPIFDYSGDVVAAISVSGLLPHVLGPQKATVISHVRQAAFAISAKLGYRGTGVGRGRLRESRAQPGRPSKDRTQLQGV